jgi:hypothetical protein
MRAPDVAKNTVVSFKSVNIMLIPIFCQLCLDAIFGSANICHCGSYRQSDGAHEDAKPREGKDGNDIFVVVVKGADTKNEE